MKIYFLVINIFILIPQLVFAQSPVELALEIVKGGIESHQVSHQAYLNASRELLKTAQTDPELITENKGIIIQEIENLDHWDSFSEISRNYMHTLIKTLVELSDPGLTKLFLRECQHGSFVAEGLANIGRPALTVILDELDGIDLSCALSALGKMAEKQLSPHSNLAPEQLKTLEGDFRNHVFPRLQAELAASIAQNNSAKAAIIKKALADIKRFIK